MLRDSKITELLKVNALNKKQSDKALSCILENICFELLDCVSSYIYKEKKLKQAEYNSFCSNIFKMIDCNIKLAHKSKTFSEYEKAILHPVNHIDEIVDSLVEKYKFIEKQSDDPKLLVDLKEANEQIYKKFFVRKSRKRKVKTNG
jgi:DNA gyrase/topoisomerase IV subunit B